MHHLIVRYIMVRHLMVRYIVSIRHFLPLCSVNMKLFARGEVFPRALVRRGLRAAEELDAPALLRVQQRRQVPEAAGGEPKGVCQIDWSWWNLWPAASALSNSILVCPIRANPRIFL